MNGDTISRQAALDAVDERLMANDYSNAALVSELNRLHGILARLPSEERRGRWKTLKGYSNVLLCSECDTPYEKKEFAITPNYCYNCGARMINENE